MPDRRATINHHAPRTPTVSEERREAEERHAEVRAQVREAAKRGRRPRLHPDDIREAFAGHEDERQEIAELRAEADARDAARQRAAEERETLRAETKRVLKEWDQEREQKAEAEARSRLGMKAAA